MEIAKGAKESLTLDVLSMDHNNITDKDILDCMKIIGLHGSLTHIFLNGTSVSESTKTLIYTLVRGFHSRETLALRAMASVRLIPRIGMHSNRSTSRVGLFSTLRNGYPR
jgi:hypothetical protein